MLKQVLSLWRQPRFLQLSRVLFLHLKLSKANPLPSQASSTLVLPGKIMALTYTKPNASPLTRIIVTIFDGSYTDAYTPDATGAWSVSASWEVDSLFDGASSSKSFIVTKKLGCLIAAATYGSELSPQVKFLRRFRDNKSIDHFCGQPFHDSLQQLLPLLKSFRRIIHLR